MADSNTDLSASILGGSDVIFDFYCQPCDSENLHVEACGYCEQCQEYLCDSCTRIHRKYAALKSHKILDKTNMPKGQIIRKVRDVLTETCPTHVDKILEYFCNIHKELCCSVCLNTTHKKCEDTSYVPDVANGAASSLEYKDLVTKLAHLVSIASIEQMKLGSINHDNDACRSKAVANIKAFRKKLDKELDKAEQDTISKVTALHQKNSNRLKSATQKCQSVLSDANQVTSELVEKYNANKKNQLFVDMKLATHRLAAIETEMKDVVDCKTSRYVFNQDEKVQDMMASLSAIWSLSLRQEGENTEARYLKEVNAKTAEDTEDCGINDIAVLPGCRIVMIDIDNVAVKLIDVKFSKVTSRLCLSSKPYALTRTEANQVAVSLSGERKIELLTVTDVLTRSRTIDVPGQVFQGLSYDGDTFFVVYPHSQSVKAVDMSGRVLRTVYADNDTDPLFKLPRLIALNLGKDVLYVTDIEANSVTTMTLKGKIISVCRHVKLENPQGVSVGRDGAVYVCSHDNHTVHQISATGQHVKVLLDHQRGLADFPRAIAYDEDSDRLWIGSGSSLPADCNFVRVFQLA